MKLTVIFLSSFLMTFAHAADPRGYQGKFAKQIYTQVDAIAGHQCDSDSCTSIIDRVECSWENGETPKGFECSFNKNGAISATKLQGAEAKKIVSLMQKYGKVESDTVATRAKFSQAQKVSCREVKAEKKPTYNCTLSAAGRAPDSAAEPVRVNPDKIMMDSDLPLPDLDPVE